MSLRLERIGDCPDGPKLTTAVGTALGIEVVDTCDELGPRRAKAVSVRTHVFDGEDELDLRRRTRNDLSSLFGGGGQDAGVSELMLPWWRHEPRDAPQQGEWFQENDALSVLGGLSQGELDATITGHSELIFSKCGPGNIPTELLSPLLVPASDGDVGVDAEPTVLEGRADDASRREHRWLRETAEKPPIGGAQVLFGMLEVALFLQKGRHPLEYFLGEIEKVALGGRRAVDEAQRLVAAVVHEHAIEDEQMQMRGDGERFGKSLYSNNGPALRPNQTSCFRPALHPSKDRAHEDLGELREYLAPAGEQASQIKGRAQDILPNRNIGEDVVDEMGGGGCHTPSATARADRSGFA